MALLAYCNACSGVAIARIDVNLRRTLKLSYLLTGYACLWNASIPAERF
jgi:hypothetical protein